MRPVHPAPPGAPTPNPSPEGEGRHQAPPLQGRGWGGADNGGVADQPAEPLRGRGKTWGIPKSGIDTLHHHARRMRNTPTEPEARLWARLSRSQLKGCKFRRQAAIGPFIADFLCPAARLIVEIDGHTHDAAKDAARDTRLLAQGYRTLRFSNVDVLRNMDGVLHAISAALAVQTLPPALRAHPNPSPEGAGLLEAS